MQSRDTEDDLRALQTNLLGELPTHESLRIDLSEGQLQLLLDRGTGLGQYEECCARKEHDGLVVGCWALAESAKETFCHCNRPHSEIFERVRQEVEAQIAAGEPYERNGYRPMVFACCHASLEDVGLFFRLMLAVFEKKLDWWGR